MCHLCPEIPVGQAQEVNRQLHQSLDEAQAEINRHISNLDEMEDYYRTLGIMYHTTQMRTRQPQYYPSERLDHLKDIFVTSRVEEYETIFARKICITNKLAGMASDVLRCYRGRSLEERYHRFHVEIAPSLDQIEDEYEDLKDDFEVLEVYTSGLCTVNGELDRTGNTGYTTAWRCVGPYESWSQCFVPIGMQEEWNTFRAWVWSLPETQRAVGAGFRTLDGVALDLAFVREDRELRGFIYSPHPDMLD